MNTDEITASMLTSERSIAQSEMKKSIESLRRLLDDYEKFPNGPHSPGNVAYLAAKVETAQMRYHMADLALTYQVARTSPAPQRAPRCAAKVGRTKRNCMNKAIGSTGHCAHHQRSK